MKWCRASKGHDPPLAGVRRSLDIRCGDEVSAGRDAAGGHCREEYGSGSSRDWAAKGPRLLGVRVVIAESFERIHRSNLIGMGILPLEFPQDVTRKTLALTGEELIDISDLQSLQPGKTVPVTLTRADGKTEELACRCRIDTATELTYYQNDGILHYVIRKMLD